MSLIRFSFTRRFATLAALGVALAGAAACGSTVDQTESAASPDIASPAEHGAGHAGPFLKAALAMDLRPEQRTALEAVKTRLHEQSAPVRDARAKLTTEVAQEVRAGKLDKAALQPLVDQVVQATTAMKPTVQQAAQQVHDTLDASQRKALVASLRDHAAQTWGHGQMRAHMGKMAAELGLTDAQRDAIKAQMHQAFADRAEAARAEHGQMKARMEALAAAFESDTFDAKALDVGAHHAEAAKHVMGMHGVFLNAALPVLTPQQREVLATKIQAKADALED